MEQGGKPWMLSREQIEDYEWKIFYDWFKDDRNSSDGLRQHIKKNWKNQIEKIGERR